MDRLRQTFSLLTCTKDCIQQGNQRKEGKNKGISVRQILAKVTNTDKQIERYKRITYCITLKQLKRYSQQFLAYRTTKNSIEYGESLNLTY
mmetsp:Transcript_9984/g.21113  ORF Transcript_9984/g.21113 Transcript_9984/m.21113 type:complete len:91 (-) Transcript_9984:187-459(-)